MLDDVLDKITLGDSYRLVKGIPDRCIDLIITDPPYKIGKNLSGKSGLFKSRKGGYCHELCANDSRLISGIDFTILQEFFRVMKKVNCFIWCNKEQIYDYINFFVYKKHCNFEILIWEKHNVPPFFSTHFLKDKEYCLYFWEKGVNLRFSNMDEARTVFHSNLNLVDKKLYGHPTIKPLKYIESMISVASNIGDIVFDPFSGSGTTACACKELSRHFVSFEIDPMYWRTSIDRLNGITKGERDAGVVQMKLF